MSLRFIDNFLNTITMYRLVLYYLCILLAVGIVLSGLGVLPPYSAWALLASLSLLISVGLITNNTFAYIFKVPTNVESVYITALILALIITPPDIAHFVSAIPFITGVAVVAMASKFLVAISKKHIFNPTAFAVVVSALVINQSASWWIGNLPMMPLVVLGGMLIVRKLRRSGLVISFFVTALALTVLLGLSRGQSPTLMLSSALAYSPMLFFGFVMLTEPFTTPPTKRLQILYGVLVGFLYVPFLHWGNNYITPELALVAGNIFSYAVSPKGRLLLKLKEKHMLSRDSYEFVFTPDMQLAYRPGQYMEWTLGHAKSDSRGNRRYFTLASSPTEKDIRLGVKFYDNSSSFKKALHEMKEGGTIIASQLSGEFILPRDVDQKLVFIAGGIGITPFRSMVKYLLDKKEKRDITLLYSNTYVENIMYKDIFDTAHRELGIKTIYTLTEEDGMPKDWGGARGKITADMIKKEVPDYQDCLFYISGPHAMVTAFEDVLKAMGVLSSKIKVDFFPGFV